MENKQTCSICPVSINNHHGTECLKNNCAWWDKNSDRCAILTVASCLSVLTGEDTPMFTTGKPDYSDKPYTTPFCNGCNHLHNTYCKKHQMTVMLTSPYRPRICMTEGSYE